MAAVSIILVVVGFVLGSMSSQIRASDRFVSKDQYEGDIAELKQGIDRLLQFHMEEHGSGR